MSDCDPGCERLRAAFFVLGVLRMGARDPRQGIRGSGSQAAVEAGPSNRGKRCSGKGAFSHEGQQPTFHIFGPNKSSFEQIPIQ